LPHHVRNRVQFADLVKQLISRHAFRQCGRHADKACDCILKIVKTIAKRLD
jgi:hypothetical protein